MVLRGSGDPTSPTPEPLTRAATPGVGRTKPWVCHPSGWAQASSTGSCRAVHGGASSFPNHKEVGVLRHAFWKNVAHRAGSRVGWELPWDFPGGFHIQRTISTLRAFSLLVSQPQGRLYLLCLLFISLRHA